MKKILLIGNGNPQHVGCHLARAAASLDLDVRFCDVQSAYAGGWFWRQLNWRFLGHRPVRMDFFEKEVLQVCGEFSPEWLLTTGFAPLSEGCLRKIKSFGTATINFLTDDPWNPTHRAPWFFKALLQYDHVFTPRRSNLEDLRKHDCRHVMYLPFAYSPEIHFAEAPKNPEEKKFLECDVLFVGGADEDRRPYITALIRAGLKVHLYGGYWDRFVSTRASYCGMADARLLRVATSCAKITLCLVRRANRDGHAMRSFEAPAMKGCVLMEDTAEHRHLFGPEGETTLYFKTPSDVVKQARRLLSDDHGRECLAESCHFRITRGSHTYTDRLKMMLET